MFEIRWKGSGKTTEHRSTVIYSASDKYENGIVLLHDDEAAGLPPMFVNVIQQFWYYGARLYPSMFSVKHGVLVNLR